MEVEAVVPEEHVGDVIGNLSASRGLIEGMEMRLEGIQSVRAMVPLAEMFGYATRLRSMTQGRGNLRWNSITMRRFQKISLQILFAALRKV